MMPEFWVFRWLDGRKKNKKSLVVSIQFTFALGISSSASAELFPPVIELSELNGRNGLTLYAAASRHDSGGSVAAAGDVNGDGIDDILIGADCANPNGFCSGSTYVVFGRTGIWPNSINLGSLDGDTGFALHGELSGDSSGSTVSAAGDVNGVDDLIIGAANADRNGVVQSGRSYVVFGTRSARPAAFELSSLNGSNGFAINGQRNDAVGNR